MFHPRQAHAGAWRPPRLREMTQSPDQLPPWQRVLLAALPQIEQVEAPGYVAKAINIDLSTFHDEAGDVANLTRVARFPSRPTPAELARPSAPNPWRGYWPAPLR